jgi:hypothetical protein
MRQKSFATISSTKFAESLALDSVDHTTESPPWIGRAHAEKFLVGSGLCPSMNRRRDLAARVSGRSWNDPVTAEI